jgi:hypothetical protein
MASGRLGGNDLSAITLTTIYTVPASTVASVTVRFCNRSSTAIALVRLAISAAATPAAAEYLEYDAVLAPNGVLECTGLVLEATRLVVAYSSVANVTCQVYGWEE